MTIAKWDPFRNITTLQDRINSLFEESFGCSADDDAHGLCSWKPVVDILDTAAGIIVRAEIAGVAKEDVTVEVRDNVLTIRGERKADSELSEEVYLRRERCFGNFQRAFALHHAVSPDQVKAVFKNGILEITLPHPATEKPRQITIDVK